MAKQGQVLWEEGKMSQNPVSHYIADSCKVYAAGSSLLPSPQGEHQKKKTWRESKRNKFLLFFFLL